jgi:hypothetical protein
MKTLIALSFLTLLQGCALLGWLGIDSPKDLAPTLSACHQVDYHRKGVDVEIKAKCRVSVN